jgi:aminoglycoside 6'-N-acetyltransferase
MMDRTSYFFNPARVDELAMLRQWMQYPHVNQWWGTDDPYDDEELADCRVSRWIVSFDGRPFAFMQDYSVHGWDQHHFDYLPKGSRGIDQFIGDPDMIGLGHGTSFIRQRMQSLFEAGVRVIATDPHPQNKRAIAVYQKLGFRVVGVQQDTEWGLILPMEACPQTRPVFVSSTPQSSS